MHVLRRIWASKGLGFDGRRGRFHCSQKQLLSFQDYLKLKIQTETHLGDHRKSWEVEKVKASRQNKQKKRSLYVNPQICIIRPISTILSHSEHL